MVNANGKLTSGFSHSSSRTAPQRVQRFFKKNAETEREVTKLQFLS